MKDKIDTLNKEIEIKDRENDRLNLELQMIKKNMIEKDNYYVIEKNASENKKIDLTLNQKIDLTLSKNKS